MGCDVHLSVETPEGDRWVPQRLVPSWAGDAPDPNPRERRYDVFAFLADVRYREGGPVGVIAHRGMPAGSPGWAFDPDDGTEWAWLDMADYGHTWATVAELRALAGWPEGSGMERWIATLPVDGRVLFGFDG